MPRRSRQTVEAKLGPEFRARLRRAKAGQRIGAIAVLETLPAEHPPARRQSRQERKALAEQVKKLGRRALPDIDKILKRHKGRRLGEDVDAIGSITIETTPAGIEALARCDKVKVLLENQRVSLPEREKRSRQLSPLR